jgi:hypothetical protein
MGYSHYWRRRSSEIDRALFGRIASDLQRIILPLDDLNVRLAGELGEGLPEINSERIAFNGLSGSGHLKNEEIFIPNPAPEAWGIGSSVNAIVKCGPWGVELRQRACCGKCSHEAFVCDRIINVPRRYWSNGGYFDYTKTAFKPYDLAVQCALLICKHHLGDQIQVESVGSNFHWDEARHFCHAHLDYSPDEFLLDQ